LGTPTELKMASLVVSYIDQVLSFLAYGTSSLAVTSRDTSSEVGKSLREMCINFAYKYLFHTFCIINMP
jgi:hypothetical protein